MLRIRVPFYALLVRTAFDQEGFKAEQGQFIHLDVASCGTPWCAPTPEFYPEGHHFKKTFSALIAEGKITVAKVWLEI